MCACKHVMSSMRSAAQFGPCSLRRMHARPGWQLKQNVGQRTRHNGVQAHALLQEGTSKVDVRSMRGDGYSSRKWCNASHSSWR